MNNNNNSAGTRKSDNTGKHKEAASELNLTHEIYKMG